MANTPTSSGSATQTNRGTSGKPTPDLAADASALMDEAKSTAGIVAEEAKEQVASLADRAKEEVGAATEKARSMATDQKDMLAEQVGGVAEAIDRAASELESNNGPSAHYARLIADNAQKLSATIRDNNVDDLLGMAQDFGRKQPALFVGAAALLGFAASRFVMASAKRRDEQSLAANADYSSDGYHEYAGEPANNSPVQNSTGTGGM
jgi:hypothetical protein